MSSNAHTELGLTDLNGACNCSGHGNDHAHEVGHVAPAHASPVRAEYLVDGMTCSHCVSSVTEELSALEGVEGVTVDLHAGGASRVTVASAAPISEAAVRAAVEEAGYSLSARP
jgi:copper chaperone CopZ